MKKVIILPDCHLTESIPEPYKVVKKFIKKNEFDEIILLGDFMDIAALSAWDMDKKRVIEGKRYLKEVKVANKELDFLAEHTKKITYILGNHEDRVERYLDKNPELEGMLEIPKLLELEKRGIEFVPMNELYQLGHCYFTHGMWTNKYHAQAHLMRLGCNIVYGHTHSSQTAMMNMKMQEPIMAYGLGCLCGHDQAYLKGKPASWINQFGMFYYDEKKGNFNLYPVNVIENKFMLDGKEWK